MKNSAGIILYRILHKGKGLICRFVEPKIGWGKFLTGGVKVIII